MQVITDSAVVITELRKYQEIDTKFEVTGAGGANVSEAVQLAAAELFKKIGVEYDPDKYIAVVLYKIVMAKRWREIDLEQTFPKDTNRVVIIFLEGPD